jgi:hypothetical protein
MHRLDVDSLARIASGGDLAALNVLLVTVRPEVLRLCTRLLSNREDAEDACQDTLLAVARGLPGFEGRSAFRTWLYRLAATGARVLAGLPTASKSCPTSRIPAAPVRSRLPASICSTPWDI